MGTPSNASAIQQRKKDFFHGINGMMNPALLSNIALVFKAIIKLGTHVKGAIEYPDSFNGTDAVVRLFINIDDWKDHYSFEKVAFTTTTMYLEHYT